MASATQKINEIISSLENKITVLRARNEINVSMRIDKVIPYLEELLSIAKDDISTRKFDIVEQITGSCTLSYEVDGESVSAGSNVLTYGDELTITATPASHYVLKSLKVNGVDFESGDTITVTTDLTITVVAELETFDLTITAGENSTISVTRNGVAVTAGTDKLSYGDVLTISASAGEGYTLSTLTVNGTDFVSGQTFTVTDDVTIVSSATEIPAEPIE